MNIGIIGAGALGSNAARLLVKSGVSATIANSRGPRSLSRLVGELGPSVKACSVEEAASADMVLVAVRWVDLEKALGGLPAWNDRIVTDEQSAMREMALEFARTKSAPFAGEWGAEKTLPPETLKEAAALGWAA
jgi:predicted dinucleotide-binding enzyme